MNVKLNLNLNEGRDRGLFSLSDEFKVGFPFSPRNNLNLYLETRLRRNGEVKVHLDGGNVVKTRIYEPFFGEPIFFIKFY